MKEITIRFIVSLLPVTVLATGVSEKDLLCDLSSPTTLPVVLDQDNLDYNLLNSTVAARLKDPTVYHEMSVCVVSETETNVLGIHRLRRDIVEIPYKSPAVVAKEREQTPDMEALGHSVRRFRELRAPLGEWQLAPYARVSKVSVDPSDTVTGFVEQVASMNLVPDANLVYRIIIVDVRDKLLGRPS